MIYAMLGPLGTKMVQCEKNTISNSATMHLCSWDGTVIAQFETRSRWLQSSSNGFSFYRERLIIWVLQLMYWATRMHIIRFIFYEQIATVKICTGNGIFNPCYSSSTLHAVFFGHTQYHIRRLQIDPFQSYDLFMDVKSGNQQQI